MNTKKLLVSFVMMASIFLMAVMVSAAPVANLDRVEVNNVDAMGNDAAVMAGETATVEVVFTAVENASDVRLKVALEGEKKDSETTAFVGDVEDGKTYRKVVSVKVPYDLRDEVSEDMVLSLRLWNKDFRTEQDFSLRVQRPAYNAEFMSLGVAKTVEAGKLFPVDVVIKNRGYNDLSDLYVTAKIEELGVEKTAFFGDLVAIEDNTNDNDEEEVVSGRLFLDVPFNVKEGVYALTVEASNEDLSVSKTKQIAVEKSLGSNIVVSGNQLLVLNPTTSLLALRLVPEASDQLSVSLSDSVVAVPAGSTKSVTVTPAANTATAGTYSYKVNVFSLDGELLETVTLNATVDGSVSNAFVVFTVILTVIFLVLLVVLVVLVTRKPEKADELGESYY